MLKPATYRSNIRVALIEGGIHVPTPAVLSPNAKEILEQRYKGPSDNDASDIFRRVSLFVARAEGTPELRLDWGNRFYDAMSSLEFLPNSPTLRNAGYDSGCLSGCYVLPIDDCMQGGDGQHGITDAATSAIMVQKWGGGTGFSGGRLRPRGDPVRTTHRTACGPVEVLRYLNASSNLVTQASFRAGANMFILPVDHPDIMEFIHCKTEDPEALSRFNISVGVTYEFLQAYDTDCCYPLVNPRTGETVDELSARDVMHAIAEATYRTGDPGIFNLSLANERNPDKHRVSIEASNPCSEQTLPAFGSCTLGSIDVSKFVTDQGFFDVPAFTATVNLGIRFLDNVVSLNQHPLTQIQKQASNDRRIGLGLMGWHDFLILHGVAYGSDASLALANEVGKIFQSAADRASNELAQERGAYPWWEGSPAQKQGKMTMRNATRTNMAPTGTLSIIAGCSSGIEPRFGLANWRKYYDPHEEKFITFPDPEVGRAFEAVAKANGFWDVNLLSFLADGRPLSEWAGHGISNDTLEVLATATEINPGWHIQVQAAWQRHVDNAISKTINMPAEAKPEDIENAMITAMEQGCVSTTVYRDGSRDNQVLTNGKQPDQHGAHVLDRLAVHEASATERRRMPNPRDSITFKIEISDWEGYATVGLFDDGAPGEIFINSQEGSTIGGLLDAWATAVSIALQHGTPLVTLVQKMRSTRFEPHGITKNDSIHTATSIIDYIGHWLQQRYINGDMPKPEHTGMLCPKCGGSIIIQMGCEVCEGCGWERCG